MEMSQVPQSFLNCIRHLFGVAELQPSFDTLATGSAITPHGQSQHRSEELPLVSGTSP